ncbi:MAG: GH32 C-terminal domain-containing protein, partial [Bacteroidota bacterium]|nr:GH32 C-terminal domain-containing protein [Bacteroidota bacterium]
APVIELTNKNGEMLAIGYDAAKKIFYIDRTHMKNQGFSKDFPGYHTAPRQSGDSLVTLHLFIDQSSVEVFADKGSVVMTDLFYPEELFTEYSIKTAPHSAIPVKAVQYALRSIWP